MVMAKMMMNPKSVQNNKDILKDQTFQKLIMLIKLDLK